MIILILNYVFFLDCFVCVVVNLYKLYGIWSLYVKCLGGLLYYIFYYNGKKKVDLNVYVW